MWREDSQQVDPPPTDEHDSVPDSRGQRLTAAMSGNVSTVAKTGDHIILIIILKVSGPLYLLITPTRRCYEAKFYAVLVPLRCPFRWYPCSPKSFRSVFDQNPWTIVRRFEQKSLRVHTSSLEGAMKLKMYAILLLLRFLTLVQKSNLQRYMYPPLSSIIIAKGFTN